MTVKARQPRRIAAIIGRCLFSAVGTPAAGIWWKRFSPAAPPSAGEGVPGTVYSYECAPPHDPTLKQVYALVREMDVFQNLVEVRATDGRFVLPRPLHFVTAECQQEKAFLLQPKAELVLCYEIIKDILAKGETIAREEKLGRAFISRYLSGALRFIMLHELGHALIRELDLPITGQRGDIRR
ncbi:DUF4344 domain-containing metallopeptidase [Dyella telluris]|uniref:Uncharacterized protein n=1 Tax=Dyella telluris TaxID=2763498 RepID=A0A7G8Q016_9GAMM|nr:DUF4344 domain-containing metallopeptidase [Dyella telluris]QNK00124.1 hypothetical protein H8F01_13425 [Dyella telluris]